MRFLLRGLFSLKIKTGDKTTSTATRCSRFNRFLRRFTLASDLTTQRVHTKRMEPTAQAKEVHNRRLRIQTCGSNLQLSIHATRGLTCFLLESPFRCPLLRSSMTFFDLVSSNVSFAQAQWGCTKMPRMAAPSLTSRHSNLPAVTSSNQHARPHASVYDICVRLF